MARAEPNTVSLTAFNHLINSLAETLRPFKTKIFVLEAADKTQEYLRISSAPANYDRKFCFEGVLCSTLANLCFQYKYMQTFPFYTKIKKTSRLACLLKFFKGMELFLRSHLK